METAGAERVILLFFLRIGKYGVSLVDLLELVLCTLIIRIAIGVILYRQFAERLLDIVRRGTFFDSERLVIIDLCHGTLHRSLFDYNVSTNCRAVNSIDGVCLDMP